MSQVPISSPLEMNGGFNTGMDLLDGVLGAYYKIEGQKAQHELQNAQIQQERLMNAVNVDQQINDARAESQGRPSAGIDKKYLYLGAGVLALIVVVVVVVK